MQSVLSKEGKSGCQQEANIRSTYGKLPKDTSEENVVNLYSTDVEKITFYDKFSIYNLYYCFLKISPNYVLVLTIPVFAPAYTDSNSNVEMSKYLKFRVYVWAGGNRCVSFGGL